MEISTLSQRHLDAIRKFVATDEFIEIKDAFISHTPEGGSDGNRTDDPAKNLGKFLGTRYVFNKMEEISRKAQQSPKQKTENQGGSRKDPDLE